MESVGIACISLNFSSGTDIQEAVLREWERSLDFEIIAVTSVISLVLTGSTRLNWYSLSHPVPQFL